MVCGLVWYEREGFTRRMVLMCASWGEVFGGYGGGVTLLGRFDASTSNFFI